MKKNILFFGAGRMGGAILSKLINECSDYYNFFVIAPSIAKDKSAFSGKCKTYSNVEECSQENDSFDVVFVAVKPQIFLDVAVKPQIFLDVASKINAITGSYTVIISVMAGIGTESICSAIGNTNQVIRCMPNIAATVGSSASACFAGERVIESSKKITSDVIKTVGSCHWVDDEELLHGVTGISGSGPAYFFAFVEAMISGGKLVGLDAELSHKLAIETMVGAAKLLLENDNATQLRETVTSPKGTTAAALDTFGENNKLNDLTHNAIKSAVKRSMELSK